MIYREYFNAIANHGRVKCSQAPTLLAVAPGDLELYLKILLFYRSNYIFMLSLRNERDFDKNVSTDQVQSIQPLSHAKTPEYQILSALQPPLCIHQNMAQPSIHENTSGHEPSGHRF
jgi:hypothetical protein